MTRFAEVLAELAGAEGEPGPELAERLQRYSRYLAVLAEELEALKRHDTARLPKLAEERRELEAELERAGAGDELAALVEVGIRMLETEAEQGGATRSRWLELESGTLRAARGLRTRPRGWGEYGRLRTADASLDVRF